MPEAILAHHQLLHFLPSRWL